MVQLKAFVDGNKIIVHRGFQFLMVQLKEGINPFRGDNSCVSIPNGSIKSFRDPCESRAINVSIPNGSIKRQQQRSR